MVTPPPPYEFQNLAFRPLTSLSTSRPNTPRPSSFTTSVPQTTSSYSQTLDLLKTSKPTKHLKSHHLGTEKSPIASTTMDSLTTTLHLSQSTHPETVASHPAYRILYANNPDALTAFITFAKSITYEEAGSNEQFVNAILADEKGEGVNYSIIESNLTQLRMSANIKDKETKKLAEILDCIDKLLMIRKAWLEAGVRYFSFDVWYSMVQGLFVKANDPEMLAPLSGAGQTALENYLGFRAEFSDVKSQAGHAKDRDELMATYRLRHRDLIDYKTKLSLRFGGWKAIHAAIDTHLQTLDRERTSAKEKQKARLIKRKQLKAQHLPLVVHQIGQLGMIPMQANVSNALDQLHENMFKEHFQVKEDERDEEEVEEERKWQEEVLNKDYNKADEECECSIPRRGRRGRRLVIEFGKADVLQCMDELSLVLEEREKGLKPEYPPKRSVGLENGRGRLLGPGIPPRRYKVKPRKPGEERTTMKSTQTTASQNVCSEEHDGQARLAFDTDTIRTKTPSSLLYDVEALAWMKVNYGQRKEAGLSSLWKALLGRSEQARRLQTVDARKG